tara:strand:+ start:52 stop:318 length:267 start_codon:yes stop_codon:yes gene_type:complete
MKSFNPSTSHKSFAEIQDEAANQRNKMRKFVIENEGYTSQELGKLSDEYDRYQFARRLPELRVKGILHNPSERPCGVTGKKAMIWAVA